MNQTGFVSISPELLARIDRNRGSLSREDFIRGCLDALLPKGPGAEGPETYATREEFEQFQHKIERLERSFIEFFVTYGLELGK